MAKLYKFIRLTFKVTDEDDIRRKIQERTAKGGFDFKVLDGNTVSFCADQSYKGFTENGQKRFDLIHAEQKKMGII
jgi:hypothetical protein